MVTRLAHGLRDDFDISFEPHRLVSSGDLDVADSATTIEIPPQFVGETHDVGAATIFGCDEDED